MADVRASSWIDQLPEIGPNDWELILRQEVANQHRPLKGRIERLTLYLHGDYGIWKTEKTEETVLSIKCPACAEHPHHLALVDLTQSDPTDIGGLLVMNPVTGKVEVSPNPEFLLDQPCPVVIFVDDVPNAEVLSQRATWQLTSKHRIRGKALPKGSLVILAGNPPELHPGSTEIERGEKLRVGHFAAVFRYPDWREWAVQAGIHPLLTSFFEASPSWCYKPDPDAPYSAPIPRQWSKVSYILWNYPEDLHDAMIQAYVGKPAAIQFAAWRDTASKLGPLIQDVRAGKNPVPANLSEQFYVCSVLVDDYRTDRKKARRLLEYALAAKRQNPEAVGVMVNDACRVEYKPLKLDPRWPEVVTALSPYMVADEAASDEMEQEHEVVSV